MTSFDYVVLTIIGISIILSVLRGFFREALSILGWIAAFVVAKNYANQLLPMIPMDIPSESLRILAAFLVLFFATLLVASLLAIALASVFKKMGLGWLNRSLGAIFGLVRGFLIVCIIVFLAGLTDLPNEARWRNAMFSAPLEALVISMLPLVPISIAKHVKYD